MLLDPYPLVSNGIKCRSIIHCGMWAMMHTSCPHVWGGATATRIMLAESVPLENLAVGSKQRPCDPRISCPNCFKDWYYGCFTVGIDVLMFFVPIDVAWAPVPVVSIVTMFIFVRS